MSVDARAVIAACNNADLYEAMFETQGLDYKRLPFAFVGLDSPPPYYSNLTTLSSSCVDEIMWQIRAIAERFNGVVGLKDSFCQLDLTGMGFEILFAASWIWRDPGTEPMRSDWQPVLDEADLLLWEEAWKLAGSPTQRRMFTPEMMLRPEIVFLGRKIDGAFEAGCIANKSAGCMGLSNIFSVSPSPAVFAEAAAAAGNIDRRMPLAGYEADEALEFARMAGFEKVGDLRILVARNANC